MAEETITIFKVGTEQAVKSIADLRDNIKTLKDNLNDLEDRIADEFSSMKLTKVWENPNPSALEFAAQTITIEGEIDDIILEYRWTSIYDCSSFVHFKTALTSSVGIGFSLKDTDIQSPEEGSVDNVSINKVWSRNVHFYIADGSTKLDFKDCIQFYQRSNGNSGFGVGNSRLVPVAIYRVGDIYNS